MHRIGFIYEKQCSLVQHQKKRKIGDSQGHHYSWRYQNGKADVHILYLISCVHVLYSIRMYFRLLEDFAQSSHVFFAMPMCLSVWPHVCAHIVYTQDESCRCSRLTCSSVAMPVHFLVGILFETFVKLGCTLIGVEGVAGHWSALNAILRSPHAVVSEATLSIGCGVHGVVHWRSTHSSVPSSCSACSDSLHCFIMGFHSFSINTGCIPAGKISRAICWIVQTLQGHAGRKEELYSV